MDRSTPRARRNAPSRAARTPPRGTPRRVADPKRPSIQTAMSAAYGAPGKVKMPAKTTSRPQGSILEIMRDMGADESTSESAIEEDEVEEEDKLEEERSIKVDDDDEAEEQLQAESLRAQRTTRPYTEEELEEVEEIDLDVDEIGGQRRTRTDHPSSPLSAITSKIKSIWGASGRNPETSFMTEDKIAAEARIARPRESFARKVLQWKEKFVNIWYEYGGSTLMEIVLLAFKILAGLFIVFLVTRTAQSAMPEISSISETVNELRDAIVSPIYSIIDKFAYTHPGDKTAEPQEIDFSQLKALQHSTTAQFKNLKLRLDNIESTYNRLATKIKTPVTQEKKINLFAPGSGLTVIPYLSSPTRANDLVKEAGLLARTYSRWRGYPDSVHHGQISAFTPWDDMGDCWCSPDSGGKAQITVDLGKLVIPKELVVEHVPKDATLQSGSAPKSIELWAEIRDSKRREQVIKGALQYGVHQNVDGQTEEQFRSLGHTWVRIGQWTYNIHATSNVQSFEIQVPLEEFGAPIRRLAFRTASNWGPVDYVCLYRLKLHGLVAEGQLQQENSVGF